MYDRTESLTAAKERAEQDIKALPAYDTATATQPQRDKYWSELSIEEKIERTREQVNFALNGQRRLVERINEVLGLRRDLIEHRHAIDDGGKVMLPAERGKSLRGDGELCANAVELHPSKAYF